MQSLKPLFLISERGLHVLQNGATLQFIKLTIHLLAPMFVQFTIHNSSLPSRPKDHYSYFIIEKGVAIHRRGTRFDQTMAFNRGASIVCEQCFPPPPPPPPRPLSKLNVAPHLAIHNTVWTLKTPTKLPL